MLFWVMLGFILWIYYCRFIVKKDQTPSNSIEQYKCTNERIIVYYKENKYDVTNFVKRHPGGKEVLIENNGKNIESLMNENEHSSHAFTVLEKYKIN